MSGYAECLCGTRLERTMTRGAVDIYRPCQACLARVIQAAKQHEQGMYQGMINGVKSDIYQILSEM